MDLGPVKIRYTKPLSKTYQQWWRQKDLTTLFKLNFQGQNKGEKSSLEIVHRELYDI